MPAENSRPALPDRPEPQRYADLTTYREAFRCAAATLLDAGLRFVPCRPREKVPLWVGWQHRGRTCADADDALRAVERPNLGLACAPWLQVVDIDRPEAPGELAALGCDLPATLTNRTGRGRQFLYRLPAGATSANRAAFVTGCDLKGAGGFVLCAPSIHPSGVAYAWESPTGRFDADLIADAPEWLVDAVAQRPEAEASARTADGWRELIGGTVAEGQRNDTVARLAGHLLRRYVAGPVAEALLLAFNRDRCRPPLPDREVLATLASVGARELARRERAS